jgi:hypothetical protein
VARGRETGVFDGSEWERVTRAVSHYSGARYKKFTGSNSVTAAWAWLERNGISLEEDDLSDLDSIPTLVTQVVFETNVPPAEVPRNVNTDRLPPDQVINVTNAGPDVSIGKGAEIYGTSIQVESEVLRALCPKGVTNAVRKEIMETAIDVVALPGKLYGGTNDNEPDEETSGFADQFAEAIGDLTDYTARRAGSVITRDSQWRLMTRNGLDKIKNAEGLNEASDELIAQRDNVFANMTSAIMEILVTVAGWVPADAELFCTAGRLPTMVRQTMDLWIELHMHLQRVHISDGFEWMNLHCKFFASGFRRNRQFALTRNQLIVRNYISLRDWRAKGWQDLKLFGQLTKSLHDTAAPLAPRTGAAKVWACSHCHSEMHTGGSTNCPLKDIRTRIARKIVATALKDKEDPKGALDRLIAEEIAKS